MKRDTLPLANAVLSGKEDFRAAFMRFKRGCWSDIGIVGIYIL